jgi:hypothetical protein
MRNYNLTLPVSCCVAQNKVCHPNTRTQVQRIVSESIVLRRIFGLRREKVIGYLTKTDDEKI